MTKPRRPARKAEVPPVGQTGARFGSAKLRRRWEAEEAEADTSEIPVVVIDPDGAGPNGSGLNGSGPDGIGLDGAVPAEANRPEVGYTGARFPSALARRRWQADPPDDAKAAPPDPRPTDAGPESASRVEGAHRQPEDPAVLVRPYVRTGGRTKPRRYLAMEALVTARAPDTSASWPANPEYRAVIDLCAEPRSIAEVAALSKLPVGVARVLIGDLAELGLLTVHCPASAGRARAADLALMERVLAGLRRL